MGLNFHAVCHHHRECMCISRGDEAEGLHSFYKLHQRCEHDAYEARVRPSVVEIAGDNGNTERWWMASESGYRQFYFAAEKPTRGPDPERFKRYGSGWRVEDSTSVGSIP